ncbi:unnamed protein product [Ostreobium quekettii]|uniref:RRM domain-containing protein n=1 Tax=Ostreobium quekettii TaxID=121088 RepID=A0A8S1J5S1_9CHLO|nr:unnamed protein product [Ostreobium quekettii]
MDRCVGQGRVTSPTTAVSCSSSHAAANPALPGFREEAEKAVNLNPTDAPGDIQLERSKQPSEESLVSCTKLELTGLDAWVSETTLENLFRPYGRITSCGVKSETSQSRGRCGFVEFATGRDAQAAIEARNGYNLGCLRMGIRFSMEVAQEPVLEQELRAYVPFIPQEGVPEAHRARSLCAKHVPRLADEVETREFFQNRGAVAARRLVPSCDEGAQLGLVEFKTVEQALDGISKLSGCAYGDKTLEVGPASEAERGQMLAETRGLEEGENGSRRPERYELRISGFPPEWDEKDLEDVFKGTGDVEDCKLVRSENGDIDVEGFVAMRSEDDAEWAMAVWQGNTPRGCTRPLKVAFSVLEASKA